MGVVGWRLAVVAVVAVVGVVNLEPVVEAEDDALACLDAHVELSSTLRRPLVLPEVENGRSFKYCSFLIDLLHLPNLVV